MKEEDLIKEIDDTIQKGEAAILKLSQYEPELGPFGQILVDILTNHGK